MERLFLSVLNMSLTASSVIIAIMVMRLPLKKAPKVISYSLWGVAGFRLVFPFTLESIFSLLPFKAAPIPQDIGVQTVPRIDSGITVIDNAVSAVLPAATNTASANPLQIWITIGSYVWLVGMVALLIYSFVSIILLKRRLRGATLIKDNLYEADNLKTPFVIGLFRPKIYIPSELSDEERRYIVLHEQTHVHRRDHAVKMLAYLVLCLHWFNPLAWAAFVLMGADMEMSCDERVMRQLGVDIKSNYSRSLVRVAAGRRILNGSPLAFGEGGMKERIKNVLNFKKPSRVIIVVAVVLAAVLTIGFAVDRAGKKEFIEFEVIYSDVTEYSYSVQFKYNGKLYSVYIVDGELQSAGGWSGLNEIGFAAGEKGDKYRIFEREGYSIDEFIVVQDNGFMNPTIIYVASDESSFETHGLPNEAPDTLQNQLIEYLSAVFTSAYAPYYDGLRYEMNAYEETVASSGDYTATFFWTMFFNGNGLDNPADFGKEQQVNFSFRATSKISTDGRIDLSSIQILADNSATGSANYVVPIEDFFPTPPSLVPPNYSGGKTLDDAKLLADYFAQMLNRSIDLTGDDNAIASWRALYNFVQNPVEARNVRATENSDDYIFEITGVNGDMVIETSVRIVWSDSAPWYFCEYTRYYPYAQPTAERYLSLLAQGDAEKLAQFLAVDGDNTLFMDEATRQLAFYGKYDLDTAEITTPMMYDNYRKNFYCVALDKNDDGFVIKLVYGDGLIMPLSPFEQG